MVIPPAVERSVTQVLDLILPDIVSRKCFSRAGDSGPVLIGLTGLQGSGKSTWADALVSALNSTHCLRTITLSLDDLYYPHEDLVRIREADKTNLLLQQRGQPGTHDEELANAFFTSLQSRQSSTTFKIPRFDKSKFYGEGDRALLPSWPTITGPINVVVFEGWCLGFQPLGADKIKQRWLESKGELEDGRSEFSINTLSLHHLEHLVQIDHALARYCASFMGPQHLDVLICLDTENLSNVYQWRMEQEAKLFETAGNGMTRDQVVEFVRGYMPAYELYIRQMREGFFPRSDPAQEKKQIHILLDKSREVTNIKIV